MGVRSVLAAAVFALVAVGVPADAGRVPESVLYASGGVQHGQVSNTTETGRMDGHCWGVFTDGVPSYPDAVRHDPAKELRIRLPRTDRPTAVSVEINRAPRPLIGFQTSDAPYSLRPVGARGRPTGWDVVLPPPGIGDLRLSVLVQWQGDCGTTDDATYHFHVLSL